MSDIQSLSVGIAAVEHEGAVAWGLRAGGNRDQHGRAPSIGEGLFLALDTMLTDPHLATRPIVLEIDPEEHRDLFVDFVGTLPNVTLREGCGSAGRSAAKFAAELTPGHPLLIEAAPEDSPEILVGTDGSVGPGGTGKKRGSGAAWIDEHGKFGYRAYDNFKQAVEAELQAVALAVEAHPDSRLHIVCDSRQAIRIVRHIHQGGVLGDLPGMSERRATCATAVKRALDGVHGLRIDWVKGHATHPLNLGADRLAVAVRRAAQMGTTAPTLRDIAKRIAEETMTDYATYRSTNPRQ